MIDFLASWWYILLFLLVYLSLVIFVGITTEENGNQGGQRLKGYLVLAGILIPIPFLISSYKSNIGAYLGSLYFLYIGAVFVSSYLKPRYCFLFNGFATVTQYFFAPRRKEWLLFIGGIMIVASAHQLFETWTSAQ